MATFMGSTFTGSPLDAAATPPYSNPHSALVGAKERVTTEVITFASQVAGSVFVLGTLPIGAIFKSIVLNLDTSTGSTTLAFGSTASAAKYGAAAALTSTDTRTSRAKASANAQGALTAQETVIMTTAAATLPASGTLVVELRYTTEA